MKRLIASLVAVAFLFGAIATTVAGPQKEKKPVKKVVKVVKKGAAKKAPVKKVVKKGAAKKAPVKKVVKK
ncbi:MAG: hypothetical protein ACP5VE_09230, partial [Chthonomonadales bacterium]